MKRSLAAVLAAAVLAVPACTRTVIEHVAARSPQGSPASLSLSGGLDTSADPIVQVVQKVRPAVVNVTTDLVQQGPFGTQGGQGVGSGFIVRSDGIIVTNYHVVEKAGRITVITPPPDSKRYQARVIGGDQTADLAVLKIDASGLPTVSLGDSSQLLLGQRVVALGYALALKGGPTVTTGIVSALGRTIDAQDPNCDACANFSRTYSNVIQTDAAINPGNSGGPLVNLAGQVVGINTAGAGQAENIGFAIEIDAAAPTITAAAANPSAPVAYLGVVTEDVSQSLAFQFGLPVSTGAYVVDVTPGGPAESAGVQAGYVIVGFDGHDVTSSSQLGGLIRDHVPSDHVPLEVVTPSGRKTITVTLGVNPLPNS
jgi:S1-C subfamily serine protease